MGQVLHSRAIRQRQCVEQSKNLGRLLVPPLFLCHPCRNKDPLYLIDADSLLIGPPAHTLRQPPFRLVWLAFLQRRVRQIGACACWSPVLPAIDTGSGRRSHTVYSPQNLAIISHVALNLTKQDTSSKIGVKNCRLKVGWDDDYLARLGYS